MKNENWNYEAYIDTCRYCKEQMRIRGITIKELAEKADVSETTINKFKRGGTIFPDLFKNICEAYLKLSSGDDLYGYYCKKLEEMGRNNQLLGKDMQINMQGDTCRIEPFSLERLLEDKGIDKKGFLAFRLYGASINILELEREVVKVKTEQKEKKHRVVTKVYVNYVRDNELIRTCISVGVIERMLKKLPESVYVHIGNPDWLSAIYMEEDLKDEWVDVKKFIGEIHTVSAFNHYAERIHILLTNLQSEGIFESLYKYIENKEIILED